MLVCPAYSRTDHVWAAYRTALQTACGLLSVMYGACRRQWGKKHCFLLHFHRGISFSSEKSG